MPFYVHLLVETMRITVAMLPGWVQASCGATPARAGDDTFATAPAGACMHANKYKLVHCCSVARARVVPLTGLAVYAAVHCWDVLPGPCNPRR